MQNRLKNYGLWTSAAALIFMILQNSGIGILILLGIINNPDTENPGFGDDKAP